LNLSPPAVADFNGDGAPDLAFFTNIGELVVILGNNAAQVISGSGVNGSFSTAPIVGDFNGDGKPDLAIAGISYVNGGSVPTTWIQLGNGDGTFQAIVSYPYGDPVLTGDFNGDGILDLVVVDISGNVAGVLYGNGDGSFRQGLFLSSSSGAPLVV